MNNRRGCPICGGAIKRNCLTYCSRACYGLSRRKRVRVTCAGCHAPFELRPYEVGRAARHYCSTCRSLWEDRSRPRKTLTGYTLDCFHCGVPCYRPRWRSKRYVYTFCSPECRRSGWRNLRLAWEALNWNAKGKQ